MRSDVHKTETKAEPTALYPANPISVLLLSPSILEIDWPGFTQLASREPLMSFDGSSYIFAESVSAGFQVYRCVLHE